MKAIYERSKFKITEFDAEDVISTSGGVIPIEDPTSPESVAMEKENVYGSFGSFNQAPGSWF